MEFKSRCKAFSSEPMQEYRLKLESDGRVSVWDDIAGHYTHCHSLSERTQQRLAMCALQVLGYDFARGHHYGTTEPRADRWYIVRRPGQTFDGLDYRGRGFRTISNVVAECAACEQLKETLSDQVSARA